MIRDITEDKRAGKEKIQLETQLKQAQKMESIGTLAGGIAHDFNNIMAIILGNTELALDDVPKWNSAHSSLEEIKKASLRAKNIVKQLLSFSRKTDQKLQPIQITSVIKDALKFLRSKIPTTINIHRDIQTTEETILADPTQINQIIMNLCINASQAMEQTGGDLNVTVAKVILDNNSGHTFHKHLPIPSQKYIRRIRYIFRTGKLLPVTALFPTKSDDKATIRTLRQHICSLPEHSDNYAQKKETLYPSMYSTVWEKLLLFWTHTWIAQILFW